MAEYSMNYASSLGVADEIRGITGNIKTLLAQVEEDVLKHNQDWTDEARNQFDISRAKWNKAAENMALLLGKSEAALQEMIQATQRGERDGASLWS
jgi:uncharacterized protein YukE